LNYFLDAQGYILCKILWFRGGVEGMATRKNKNRGAGKKLKIEVLRKNIKRGKGKRGKLHENA